MSTLEEFLYSRELPIRDFIPMQPQMNSKKKPLTHEILNKFSHINTESDRKWIIETEHQSNAVESNKVKEKCKIIDIAEGFQVKNQD